MGRRKTSGRRMMCFPRTRWMGILRRGMLYRVLRCIREIRFALLGRLRVKSQLRWIIWRLLLLLRRDLCERGLLRDRRDMGGSKIVDARVIVTCPGRNVVTVKITADDGVYGVGDGTLNGRELAVSADLQEHVVPCLLGRDSGGLEDRAP